MKNATGVRGIGIQVRKRLLVLVFGALFLSVGYGMSAVIRATITAVTELQKERLEMRTLKHKMLPE